LRRFVSLRRLAAGLELSTSELIARAEQIEAGGQAARKAPTASTR
jgi:hypothetical protein